jgi:hypothetical protein
MSIVSENVVEFSGKFYKITRISYDGTATTYKVDQSAINAVALEPASGAPSVSLGAADSSFEKTVTLAAGSTAATITVVVAHAGTPAGTKS